MFLEAADRPNINKKPGVKFGKIFRNDLLGGHFGPEKKYLAPLPTIPQFAADTLPAPRPLPSSRTPFPGIFNKKSSHLPLPVPRTPASASRSKKK